MRYASILVFGLLALFVIQHVALRAVGGRTVKSESNYFSSLGRIQAGVRSQPLVMVLGSSITGRLPDCAQGFEGVANLGCDGGSAVDTIRAIDEGRLPCAPVLLVEANSLPVALRGESKVAEAMREPWFRVGLHVPAVSAYARPAAFLYSPLLASRTGGYEDPGGADLGVKSRPGEPPAGWTELTLSDVERDLVADLSPRIRAIRESGTRVVFVWLPPARPRGAEPQPWIRQLVTASGSEWWDIGQQASPDLVCLTDGVHMDAATATRTTNSILSVFAR